MEWIFCLILDVVVIGGSWLLVNWIDKHTDNGGDRPSMT